MARPGNADMWARAVSYLGLSLIVPASAVGGYALGWFLDEHLHTKPVLAAIGVLAGSAAGIVEMIQVIVRREKGAQDR
ncbi:MAG TPA: AtpZ/AtpI family protein [Terriglobia bacterium]|nr:AtpZ/AtpI family protein [Terriglobia bacterium]